jgi:hypothetical protein
MTQVDDEMGQHHTEAKPVGWRLWLIGGVAIFFVAVLSLISFDALKPATATGSAAPVPSAVAVAPVPTQPAPIVPDLAWDVEHVYKDGEYKVGKDIYAGKWKTAGKVDGRMNCAITVRNPDGAIDLMKYSAGQIYVTIKDGQTVEVSDCQTLVLQSKPAK